MTDISNITIQLSDMNEAAVPWAACHPARMTGWGKILHNALGHDIYQLTAYVNKKNDSCFNSTSDTDLELTPAGILSLAYVHTLLFGRFLVSLPYLNIGGPFINPQLSAEDKNRVLHALVDNAVKLADTLNVRYLELRGENVIQHDSLNFIRTSKVHMRLDLPQPTQDHSDNPTTAQDILWKSVGPKVRNQIRKGQHAGLTIQWGGMEILDDFYHIFSRKMRDLGTPVYPKNLFREILNTFPHQAEMCVVRSDHKKPCAAALLLHGDQITEVPSASSLPEFNSVCANMFMYWEMLSRASLRGSRQFDFGRSTVNGSTFRFKKQWGACTYPAVWQYYVRKGSMDDMRPDNAGYGLAISVWKRLPVWLTRIIGPVIVRGIP